MWCYIYCERTPAYRMTAETRRQSLPCFCSAGDVRIGLLKWFTTLHIHVPSNDYKSTARIAFGVTNKFWGAGEFTNTESTNSQIEDIDHTTVCYGNGPDGNNKRRWVNTFQCSNWKECYQWGMQPEDTLKPGTGENGQQTKMSAPHPGDKTNFPEPILFPLSLWGLWSRASMYPGNKRKGQWAMKCGFNLFS